MFLKLIILLITINIEFSYKKMILSGLHPLIAFRLIKFIRFKKPIYPAIFVGSLIPDLDIIFISLPNKYASDAVSLSLNKGLNVFCEKPPGRTLKDIERMRDCEAANPGTKLMFGFNHRFHPGVMRAKSIIDSGRMGIIVALRGLYGKSGGKNYAQSWRNDFSVSGGGILLDQGIHMLDLFNFFLGGFSSAKSFLSNGHRGFDVEDNAMVILKNECNQMAVLHSSATFWKHMFQLNVILFPGTAPEG